VWQVWTFWISMLATVLLLIMSGIQSVIWLYNQQKNQSTRVSEKVYVNLAQVSVFWDLQQFINMIFFATLNVRKFNGKPVCIRKIFDQ
jgi:hypothetical protein